MRTSGVWKLRRDDHRLSSLRHVTGRGRFLLCLLFFGFALPLGAQGIGVMPMFDASAEDIGPLFAEQTTLILQQTLQAAGVHAVYLNPGGVYTPTDIDLIRDTSERYGVSAVLVTTFPRVFRPKGNRGPILLELKAQLVNPKDGTVADLGAYERKITPDELIIEYGHAHFWGTTGSRPFTHQKIGEHAEKLSAEIVASALAQARQLHLDLGTPPAIPPAPAQCAFNFRVSLPRHRIAKTYELILDGHDEAFGVTDGIASFTAPEGPHTLYLYVHDAPYNLPVQHLYPINAMLSCPTPSLAVVLGPGGEASFEAHADTAASPSM
jgi:hypothetical protein